MLCLSGFELYSRWVPLLGVLYFNECRVWIFDRCKVICLGNVIQKKMRQSTS